MTEPVTKAFAPAVEPVSWTRTPMTQAAAADSEAPTAEIQPAAPTPTPSTAMRREAWLVAAAILLGALIISLPLWLRG
jgi:hypothetical protein